jgi:hypothetical protein
MSLCNVPEVVITLPADHEHTFFRIWPGASASASLCYCASGQDHASRADVCAGGGAGVERVEGEAIMLQARK